MPRLVVADPRDPNGQAELPVAFEILSFGEDPTGTEEFYRSGTGPEIRLRFALDANGDDVLRTLPLAALVEIEARILDGFSFAAAEQALLRAAS